MAREEIKSGKRVVVSFIAVVGTQSISGVEAKEGGLIYHFLECCRWFVCLYFLSAANDVGWRFT